MQTGGQVVESTTLFNLDVKDLHILLSLVYY